MQQQNSDAFALLYHKAMRLLSSREHSLSELRRKLLARQGDEELVEQVLDRLQAQNYLNEARYAENYCHSRINRGYGPAKIRYELQQKGIKGSTLEDVFAEVDESLWLEAITKQIAKKVSNPDCSFADKMKVFRALAARGFEKAQIEQAWQDYIESIE